MAWRERPDPWYAIRAREGPWGTTYQVRLTRGGEYVLKLFRDKDHGSAKAALKAARKWRNEMIATMKLTTKQEFSRRVQPRNTSGVTGVYYRRQVQRSAEGQRVYFFWQAQTPQGVKPFRSRSFSVTHYGYEAAYEMAVKARAEFVAEVEGYVGLPPIPVKFRPTD